MYLNEPAALHVVVIVALIIVPRRGDVALFQGRKNLSATLSWCEERNERLYNDTSL